MIFPEKTKQHLVSKFKSNLLEEEDLSQEAWVMFLERQEKYDPDKGSENTFFSNCLKNRFIDLYRKRSREVNIMELNLDDPVEVDMINDSEDLSLGDMVPATTWNPEQYLEWECLVEEVSDRLHGLAKKVFDLKLDPNLDLLEVCRNGDASNATITDQAKYFSDKYFKISRNVVKRSEDEVKDTVLEVLGLSDEKNYL